MNNLENEARDSLLAEKDRLGLDKYRRQCLQALKLKTVIKVCLLYATYGGGQSLLCSFLPSPWVMPQDMAATLQNYWHGFVKQESHGSPVTAMQFNDVDPQCSNLFATVGGDQAGLTSLLDRGLCCVWTSLLWRSLLNIAKETEAQGCMECIPTIAMSTTLKL